MIVPAWTDTRREIEAHLREKDSDAGDLYRTAIDGLTQPLTHASLMVIGHCVRELIKVLPVILGYPLIERADSSRSARELHRHWVAAELPLTPDGSIDNAMVSVPGAVYSAARDVANAGANGAQNSRELTALIVTGQRGDAATASVARVHKSIEFFRQVTHARDYTKPPGPLPIMAKVGQELAIIDEALINRLANLADRAKSVRDLLAAANRKHDEVEE
jgi:hypothetical protein